MISDHRGFVASPIRVAITAEFNQWGEGEGEGDFDTRWTVFVHSRGQLLARWI